MEERTATGAVEEQQADLDPDKNTHDNLQRHLAQTVQRQYGESQACTVTFRKCPACALKCRACKVKHQACKVTVRTLETCTATYQACTVRLPTCIVAVSRPRVLASMQETSMERRTATTAMEAHQAEVDPEGGACQPACVTHISKQSVVYGTTPPCGKHCWTHSVTLKPMGCPLYAAYSVLPMSSTIYSTPQKCSCARRHPLLLRQTLLQALCWDGTHGRPLSSLLVPTLRVNCAVQRLFASFPLRLLDLASRVSYKSTWLGSAGHSAGKSSRKLATTARWKD